MNDVDDDVDGVICCWHLCSGWPGLVGSWNSVVE